MDRDEDDVSAEQPLAQEDAWFPRAYEDERRPFRPEEKARKGQKEVVCINFQDICSAVIRSDMACF